MRHGTRPAFQISVWRHNDSLSVSVHLKFCTSNNTLSQDWYWLVTESNRSHPQEKDWEARSPQNWRSWRHSGSEGGRVSELAESRKQEVRPTFLMGNRYTESTQMASILKVWGQVSGRGHSNWPHVVRSSSAEPKGSRASWLTAHGDYTNVAKRTLDMKERTRCQERGWLTVPLLPSPGARAPSTVLSEVTIAVLLIRLFDRAGAHTSLAHSLRRIKQKILNKDSGFAVLSPKPNEANRGGKAVFQSKMH